MTKLKKANRKIRIGITSSEGLNSGPFISLFDGSFVTIMAEYRSDDDRDQDHQKQDEDRDRIYWDHEYERFWR